MALSVEELAILTLVRAMQPRDTLTITRNNEGDETPYRVKCETTVFIKRTVDEPSVKEYHFIARAKRLE